MSCNPFQPLFIDTNIIYNLDMGRFPGIDDPTCLQQPTLLLDTPRARRHWLSASMSALASEDFDDVVNDSSDQDYSPTDDLFSLIESCQLSPPCVVPDVTRNDVICDLPSGDELEFLDEIYTFACFGPHCNEPCDIKATKRANGDKHGTHSSDEKEYISYCEDFAQLFITDIKTANESSGKSFEEQVTPSRTFETIIYEDKSRRES